MKGAVSSHSRYNVCILVLSQRLQNTGYLKIIPSFGSIQLSHLGKKIRIITF